MSDTADSLPQPLGMSAPADGVGGLPAQLRAAALGPTHLVRYLKVFARFDAAGRALPSWNWAAAVAAPAWLAFRGLWSWLGLWLLLVVALALLLLGAQIVLVLPPSMLAGLALALWLGLAAGFGLWADALLYRQLQRRVEAAVRAAANMQQALALLAAGAPTRRRLWAVGAGSAALLALLALAAWQWVSEASSQAAPQAPPPAHATPIRPVEQAPAPEPQPAAAALPVWDADEAAALQQDTEAALGALAEAGAGSAPVPSASASPARAAPAAAPPAAKPAEPAAAGRAPPQELRKLYINVGMFAEPANARRAQERLRAEGLPVTVAPARSASGKTLQRVRVGPFTSAAQANEAAAKVRLLGLDAVPAVQ
ncbi:SPOR domain-containing protein [Comamonas sp. NLF-1-9]|uniref:SPOR domain-containing protein n=1 Tax=Comamonas sp. NLF-1-9 TaxID=2853163 RepID=UPI001C452AA3|nr:SPOR domain-containing protein [Comamonas sp. NLF-1-9]QXL85568.1 SPOR domain-containing protein [Comamonas sp. NLF-1-9]